MRIEIVVGHGAVCRWHHSLRERITRLLPGAVIHLKTVEGGAPFPPAIRLLLRMERRLLRRSRPTLCDAANEAGGIKGEADAAVDLRIDLSGALVPTQDWSRTRLLRPLYDGRPSELMAVSALLSHRSPALALEDVANGAIVAQAMPSLEAADGLTGGLEAVFSRVTTMVEQVLLSPARILGNAAVRPPPSPPRGLPGYLLQNLAREAARALYHLACSSPHWRIGWRFTEGPGVLETGALSGRRWNALPDLGADFAADPFPVEWQGRFFVFFERFDARAGKGVICAREVMRAGETGETIPVLEEDWHLSYPFLIRHEGQLYMVPEASCSRMVTIYRCVAFPQKWEKAGVLLADIEAADATIFRHDGRYWMTSVVRDGHGGYSDTLAIHHAPDLFGAWQEHALRPVLIDARLARPAGAVVSRNGKLWRPVQDCSTGYGKALILARIDVLTADSFMQTPMTALRPDRCWPGNRLHTLNRAGPLECIDGAILTPRPMGLRRLVQRYLDRGR